MRLRHKAAAIILTFVCWGSCSWPPIGTAAAQARMQKVEIIDPNGFAQPMVAATIVVPEGWRSSGGVRWQPQAPCQADATQFQFVSQDGSGFFAVEIIPGAAWQANNLPVPQQGPGCPFLAITSAQQYVTALVQRIRPGATVLDYRPRPDLIKTPRLQPLPVQGIEQRLVTEGGEALIGYQIRGQAVREVIQVITDVYFTRMPGVVPGEVREFMTGSAMPAFAMRAPEGALNFAAADAIRASLTLDPAWQAKMQEHQNANSAIAAKGAQDRSQIIARTGREVNDIINKGWQDRQASQDRMHERTIRTIRETELFATPQGGTVELPGIQNRAWQTDRGNYLTSDDKALNPGSLGIGATEMRRID